MTHSETEPTPPEGLSERLVSELDRLSAAELRKTIIYAQERLQFQEEPGPIVEPAPGEEILRVTEHDGYTEVVKKTPAADDSDDSLHGPYLYHVRERSTPDGGSKLFWTLIGEVHPDEQ